MLFGGNPLASILKLKQFNNNITEFRKGSSRFVTYCSSQRNNHSTPNYQIGSFNTQSFSLFEFRILMTTWLHKFQVWKPKPLFRSKANFKVDLWCEMIITMFSKLEETRSALFVVILYRSVNAHRNTIAMWWLVWHKIGIQEVEKIGIQWLVWHKIGVHYLRHELENEN